MKYKPTHSFMNQPQIKPYAHGSSLIVGSHHVKVIKHLVNGGFAQVYEVEMSPSYTNPNDNTTTNIACLKRVIVPDKIGLNVLRAEVDAMKLLRNNKYIVSYIDSHASKFSVDDGSYEVLLLMEYCPKKGLIDFLNTRLQNRLTESEILNIMSQTCQGIAEMHRLRPPLIHRDIKIENVLIANDFTFKVCDFGSVCGIIRPPKNLQEFNYVQHDIMKNTTAQYRSPEMLDLNRGLPIDEKSDIWALGVFLYKLCYYTTPFEQVGESAILQSKFQYPAYPQYSDRLKNLIRVLLLNNPLQRPNICQVIEEVSRIQGIPCPMKNFYLERIEKQQSEQLLSMNKFPTLDHQSISPIKSSTTPVRTVILPLKPQLSPVKTYTIPIQQRLDHSNWVNNDPVKSNYPDINKDKLPNELLHTKSAATLTALSDGYNKTPTAIPLTSARSFNDIFQKASATMNSNNLEWKLTPPNSYSNNGNYMSNNNIRKNNGNTNSEVNSTNDKTFSYSTSPIKSDLFLERKKSSRRSYARHNDRSNSNNSHTSQNFNNSSSVNEPAAHSYGQIQTESPFLNISRTNSISSISSSMSITSKLNFNNNNLNNHMDGNAAMDNSNTGSSIVRKLSTKLMKVMTNDSGNTSPVRSRQNTGNSIRSTIDALRNSISNATNNLRNTSNVDSYGNSNTRVSSLQSRFEIGKEAPRLDDSNKRNSSLPVFNIPTDQNNNLTNGNNSSTEFFSPSPMKFDVNKEMKDSIQKRVLDLLSAAQKSPIKKTASGYGKYTNRESSSISSNEKISPIEKDNLIEENDDDDNDDLYITRHNVVSTSLPIKRQLSSNRRQASVVMQSLEPSRKPSNGKKIPPKVPNKPQFLKPKPPVKPKHLSDFKIPESFSHGGRRDKISVESL